MKRLTTAGIVAASNHESYIAEAVEQLVAQVDELVVIDDASTDNTLAVLNSLDFPNLRVLHNKVQEGVSRAYNRAVAASTSDLLLIQGGDDRSLPGRARHQLEAFEDPAVVLAYSLPRVIDSFGRVLPDSVAGEFLVASAAIDPLTQLFFESNYICAPAVAVRRTDYLRMGGFRAGLDLLQDYALWLMLAVEGRFYLIDEPVVEYRKHATNVSREYVGLDSPNRRRYAAEREYIRNRFLQTASPQTLMKLAGHAGLDLERFANLAAAEMIALIQLSHGDKLVVRRGTSFLFEAAGEADGEARLHRLGLTMQDLTRFALYADHDNLEGLSRAAAMAAAIRRISAA